jgi:hypothetical protein
MIGHLRNYGNPVMHLKCSITKLQYILGSCARLIYMNWAICNIGVHDDWRATKIGLCSIMLDSVIFSKWILDGFQCRG